jgi:hypothetical protein
MRLANWFDVNILHAMKPPQEYPVGLTKTGKSSSSGHQNDKEKDHAPT